MMVPIPRQFNVIISQQSIVYQQKTDFTPSSSEGILTLYSIPLNFRSSSRNRIFVPKYSIECETAETQRLKALALVFQKHLCTM